MADRVRMAKSDVGRVIGSQTCAADGNAAGGTFTPREVEDIIDDDVFVGVVRPHPVCRVNAFVIKALKINRIRTVNGDPARLDVTRERPDKAKVLVLIEAPKRRGIKNKGQAPAFAEDEHLKFPAEIRCLPAKIPFDHK